MTKKSNSTSTVNLFSNLSKNKFHICDDYCNNTLQMKKCLYCSDLIDTKVDDFEKIGTKYVCVFCYEDHAHELDFFDEDDTEINNEEED